MNIADAPARLARTQPDHPAIVDGDCVVSYRELDRRVGAAADTLLAAGVEVGEVVAIVLPDRPEYLIVALALARVGAVMFSVAQDLSPADFQTTVAGLGVRRVLTEDEKVVPEGLISLWLDSICEERLAVGSDTDPMVLPAGHPALVRQSSGTTGRPKTVFWSHDFMIGRLPAYRESLRYAPSDRFLQILPMSFAYSRDLCLYMLQLGGTVVINRSEGQAELIHTIRRERITQATLTPAHLRALLQVRSDRWPLLPGIRALLSTSSALTLAEREALQERVTPNFFDGYGTNEVGLITAAGPEHRHVQPDSVGVAFPGVEVRIVDEAGNTLPPNAVGLVCMRSAGMPTTYVKDPEATARHFRGGWFYPGDLAAMNGEGYLFFRGRTDDVISNQGVKFYPLEVEQVLREHERIEEVAVFGWPQPQLGETAVACVVAKEALSITDVQTFCTGRIAGHKIPSAVYTLNKLPKTRSGKVRKDALKDVLRERLARDLR